MNRRLILLLLLALPAWAQGNDVRVRLYAVHPPAKLALSGADLKWRTCEQCPENAAATLALIAQRGQLRLQGSSVPYPRLFISGSYELRAEQQKPFRAGYPLEVTAEQDALRVVIRMSLEDYVAGVLAGESGNFQNLESMKAMAVAVRTYAARFRGRHVADGFDYCDTTHCQDLRLAVNNPRTRSAAQATAGELLWSAGALAAPYYHAHCGGKLAAAGEVWPTVKAPYLKSRPDPYCAAVPLHWETTLTRAELERALADSDVKLPAGWQSAAVSARGPSGRAQRLRFSGPGGSAEVSASTVRFAVGRALGWSRIRSELYDLRSDAAGVTFTGAGAGHGVGLCQAGAEQMAAQGRTYREILAFYYPGTTVAKGSPGVAWLTRKSSRFDALVATAADAAVLDLAERLLHDAESAIGWKLAQRPRLQVFPTLDAYRDTTGQPGWIAASTRGATIRLQPLATLRARSALESTLRHELLHMILEEHAVESAPLWLREGLALYFDGSPAPPARRQFNDAELDRALTQPRDQAEQQAAYAAARARVAALIREQGKAAVLRRLEGK
ncbi:MAG TPA: SpoIID/LytB domain-containing protein [Terriglobales bacterium]|nr:SpoIID/LytB domain-containing protein [Terriglobales bacterium]